MTNLPASIAARLNRYRLRYDRPYQEVPSILRRNGSCIDCHERLTRTSSFSRAD